MSSGDLIQWAVDHPAVAVAILALVVAILALFIGPALWAYLLNFYRTRPRLRVAPPVEDFNIRVDKLYGLEAQPRVTFGVENVGGEVTSLLPTIVMTGHHPRKKSRRTFTWLISSERDLPPYVERRITATLQKHDVYGAELPNWMRDAELLGFLWFKTYTLTPTRGRAVKVRIRSADGVRLGRVRFWWELLKFRLGFAPYVTPQGTPPPP